MAINLKVTINLDGKDKSSKAFKDAEKNATSLTDKVTALSTGYLALVDIFGRVATAMAAPIKAALEAEQANQKLISSMKLMGQYTEENAAKVDEFAGALQRASGMDDDLIKSMVASNNIFLESIENSQALTVASVALAKARGIDLATANDALVKTLFGEARGLKAILPQLGNLSASSLKSGEAIRQVTTRLKEFISGDMDTASGRIERMKLAFSDLLEEIGGGIIEGFQASGAFQALGNAIGIATNTAQGQKSIFQALGKIIGDNLIKTLDTLVENLPRITAAFQTFVKAMSVTGGVFSIMSDSIKQTGLNMNELLLRFQQAAIFMTQPISVLKGNSSAFNVVTEEIKKNAADSQVVLDRLGESVKNLFSDEEGKAQKFSDLLKEALAGIPDVGEFQDPKLGKNDQEMNAQRQMQNALKEQTLQINNETSNQVVAEFTQRLAKLQDLQEDAAAKGIDISKEAAELRAAIELSYFRKLKELRDRDKADILKAAGETSKAIEAEYALQIASYKKLLDQKRIDEAEYLAAASEARRQADLQQMQTTGTAEMDDRINNISNLLSSAQSGISSVISTIGSYFGPYGTLIAGIVNMLNMTREQFTEMLNGLIDGFKALPDNLVSSISILIERFPEMMATMVGMMFDVGFWMRAAQSFVKALSRAMSNFWEILFKGGTATRTVNDTVRKTLPVRFNDDPNAGDNEFKIKDAQLAGQRRATQNFEESFDETVDRGGKTFVDYLREGFQAVLEWVGQAFKAIWNGLIDAARAVYDMLKGLWDRLWTIAKQVYDQIFAPVVRWIQSTFLWVYDSIFKPIIQLFEKTFLWVYNSIFVPILDFVGEVFLWVRTKVFDPVIKVFVDVFNFFSDTVNRLADALSVDFGGEGGGSGRFENVLRPSKWTLNNGGPVHAGMKNDRMTAAFMAMGAMRFADGGMVPGTGFRDSVPAILTPGEFVLNRQQVAAVQSQAAAGGDTYITFNVQAGAVFDRAAVERAMPTIIDNLKRDTRRGKLAINKNGVF